MSGIFSNPSSTYYLYKDNAGIVAIGTQGYKSGNHNVGLFRQLGMGANNFYANATFTYYVNGTAYTYPPSPLSVFSWGISLSNWGCFEANTEYTLSFEITNGIYTYTTPTISFKTASTTPVATTLNYPVTKPNLINSNAEIWDAKCQNWVPIDEASYSNRVLQAIGGGRYKETLIATNAKAQIYYGDI